MTVVTGMFMPLLTAFEPSSLQQAQAEVRSTGLRPELQADRYSLWKVAFDRARPTEISRQEQRGSRDERYTSSEIVRGEEGSVAIDDGEGVDRSNGHGALSTRTSDGDRAHGVGAANLSTARNIAATAALHPDLNIAAKAHALMPANRSPAQASAAMFVCKVETDCAGSNLAESDSVGSTLERATRPPPADSVNVCLSDGSVRIVVRDAGIRDDQALHAAFVTARELTGRRDSLRELTVNGRTVYRQHQPDTQQPPPALIFVC